MQLIAVDKKDKFLKLVDKDIAHKDKGILHRAFSIFIFNAKGEMLIQKRSRYKKLWPLYWSNACCSHPNAKKAKKNTVKQAEKRLKEEMGFTTKLKIIDKFYYQAQYENSGSEHELSYILTGKYDGEVRPNKKEAIAWRWISLIDLKKKINQRPKTFTPWFKKIIKDRRLKSASSKKETE